VKVGPQGGVKKVSKKYPKASNQGEDIKNSKIILGRTRRLQGGERSGGRNVTAREDISKKKPQKPNLNLSYRVGVPPCTLENLKGKGGIGGE